MLGMDDGHVSLIWHLRGKWKVMWLFILVFH